MIMILVQSSNSYEVLYNYGTLLIYRGCYNEAQEVLSHALIVGKKPLREDDEMDLDLADDTTAGTELDPIRIQLAYLAFTCGNKQEAEKILTLVLSHPTTSKVITAIASCNLIAARGCVDITEGYKRMKSISVDTFNKLTSSQQEAIRFNKAILLLLMNRVGYS